MNLRSLLNRRGQVTLPCPARLEGGTGAKASEYVKLLPYSFIGSGVVNFGLANVPVQFSLVNIACDLVLVCGNTGNAGNCFVGAQDVRAVTGTQRGIFVDPTNGPIFVYIDDLFKLWGVSDAANDDLAFAYFRY